MANQDLSKEGGVAYPPQWQRPLAPRGNGPHDGDMEQRVARLEEHVGQLRVDVGVMRERLEHTATKTWVLGGVVTMLLGLLAVAWWLAQTYLTPILQATGKQ